MRGISLAYGAALSLAGLLIGSNSFAAGPIAAKETTGHRLVAAGTTVAVNTATMNKSRNQETSPNKSRTRWGADYFPNVSLTTQDGKQVRFFDDMIKDKVVMVNFIYTHCPDVCSVETARLLNVKEILGDRVGKDIFMYSITIDPDRDTPEVLKKYKEKFGIGDEWTFLTGDEDDILLLRKKLGLFLEGEDSKYPSTDHNISMVIGNQRTGKWMKRSPFDDPAFLSAQIGSWLTNWERPEDANQNSYVNAPKLRTTTMGENVFRTRCSSCHSVGVRNFRDNGNRRLGPDLGGVVAKRDRDWLARWIAEPDKMLAEKDPLALELAAQYDNRPMPNLRLSKTEVDAVIEFMEQEDGVAAEEEKKSKKLAHRKVPVRRPIDGKFELVDADGRTVTNETYRGKWQMVFFGYTYCPDVCPTTLNTISVALSELGAGAKDVQPIFISVDHQRDNPRDLAEYTAAFDPRIVGLTGSAEQIDAASKSFNAYYKKVGKGEDYLMDHSPMVYLIAPDGKYHMRFGHRVSADGMAARMKRILAVAKKKAGKSRASLAR